MRKHNKRFAQRWQRRRDKDGKLDRSNFPQMMAHAFVKDKSNQIFAASLMRGLLGNAGIFTDLRRAIT